MSLGILSTVPSAKLPWLSLSHLVVMGAPKEMAAFFTFLGKQQKSVRGEQDRGAMDLDVCQLLHPTCHMWAR